MPVFCSAEARRQTCESQPGQGEIPKDFAMGGQAVLEGVMMRGPRRYAVAVRRPQGDIRVISKPFWPVTRRSRWLRLPLVRGVVSLAEMLALGFKSLDYSVNVAEQAARENEELGIGNEELGMKNEELGIGGEEGRTGKSEVPISNPQSPISNPQLPEERSISAWTMTGMFVLSMGLGMLLFVALPNLATHFIGWLYGGEGLVEERQPLLYNLVSGLVRVFVIVGYIWAISLLKDVRRLFQYHGAEHKVVMAFEKRLPLDLEHIRPVTTVHPRCGTTFIAVVILVSIVIFAVLAALIVAVYPPFGGWSLWARKPILILLHIVFMPLVAGIAYEITRRAGRRPDFWPYRILLAPGMAFQRITTRPPDDSMIEVALRSFFEVLEPEQKAQMPVIERPAPHAAS